jgi:hypothetical protein
MKGLTKLQFIDERKNSKDQSDPRDMTEFIADMGLIYEKAQDLINE